MKQSSKFLAVFMVLAAFLNSGCDKSDGKTATTPGGNPPVTEGAPPPTISSQDIGEGFARAHNPRSCPDLTGVYKTNRGVQVVTTTMARVESSYGYQLRPGTEFYIADAQIRRLLGRRSGYQMRCVSGAVQLLIIQNRQIESLSTFTRLGNGDIRLVRSMGGPGGGNFTENWIFRSQRGGHR